MERITEAQYDQLCDACDALLQHSSSNERKANAWLHVIREHPIFLKAYTPIYFKTNRQFFFSLFGQLTRFIIVGGYKLFHSIYRNYFLGDQLIKDIRSFENLFISHFLNESFLEHKKDFYFFDLPEKIEQDSKTSLQLYINFTGLSSRSIEKKWNKRTIVSKALPRYLPLLLEIKVRYLIFLEALSILKTKASSNFQKRIKYQAAVASFSSSTYSNYRLAVLVQHYVKNNQVKRIFTTYEGHPWERLIFAFARKVNPGIICIGYQHALVFRKQHAIRRKLNKNFEPDYILCSGEHGLQQFHAIDYLPSNKLICFGSNRTSTIKREKLAVSSKKLTTYLMLSEGDLIECLPLVEFVLKLAKKHLEKHFIIRFHPITRVDKVLKVFPELKQSIPNIELSTLSFEKDLERAHYAIYRGSTTIIKAVEYGLIPLYFSKANEITIDPLYEMQKEKFNLTSPDDLVAIDKHSKEELLEKQYKLIDYVQQFFSPIDYNEALKVKNN